MTKPHIIRTKKIIASLANTVGDLKSISEYTLSNQGIETSIVRDIAKQMESLVIDELEKEFQISIAQFQQKQVLAKSDLRQALARGQLSMPETTKISYFDTTLDGSKEVTLLLEDTYPEEKYEDWISTIYAGDKVFALFLVLNYLEEFILHLLLFCLLVLGNHILSSIWQNRTNAFMSFQSCTPSEFCVRLTSWQQDLPHKNFWNKLFAILWNFMLG